MGHKESSFSATNARSTPPPLAQRTRMCPPRIGRRCAPGMFNSLEGFSDHSYGFRPGRSAHQAVAQAQQYIAKGCGWCVDLDLEKFFDRVNHDRLMARIAKRVDDKRLLKLSRAFLNAGVMENGLLSPSVEGTPQGGVVTPLTQKVIWVSP
jgi:Reverse transcriptase (RNA-dependent DNA polymerase)